MPAPQTEEAVEALLAKGLRNHWWAICPSHFVTDKPRSLRRLGFRLCLWRDRDGAPYMIEDYCPHRGVPLSRGINLGNTVACGYHGVQVRHDGVVVSVPGAPGCKLEGMKAVRSFPLHEAFGALFAYIGDELHPNPPELILPEQLTDPAFSSFLCYAEWAGDYRYIYDNVMDPMHGTFLHKQSHSMGFGDTKASFQIRETSHGFVFEKTAQRDVNFDWTEWGETGIHWMRLEIPYPKTGGPGGNFHILGMCTPIGSAMSAVFFWRCRKIEGWQRDVWRFLYKNRLEARHWAVLEQDRVMLEDCEPDANQREILYQHDVGLVRLRRRLSKLAQEQIKALAETRL